MSEQRTQGRAWTIQLAWTILLNLPFLVCHPAWTVFDCVCVRSAAVNALLFVVPGLLLASILVRCGWLDRSSVVWPVAGSLLVFLSVIACFDLGGFQLTAGRVWNTTWLTTNLLILLNVALKGLAYGSVTLPGRDWWLTGLVFVAGYLAFFEGSSCIVPPLEDHDFDVQGPSYGLLTRFEPLLVTDHRTIYCFAHPPLLHFFVAGSFLYYDELDALAYYDTASDRVRCAWRGLPFEPYRGSVTVLTDDLVTRQVVGVDGANYHVEPPLADGSHTVSVARLEHAQMSEFFEKNPHQLETRTPNIFLSAMTVALMTVFLGRLTGRWWLGVLPAAAYATSPEVFVRSCYGGYFAITNFAALVLLMAISDCESDRTRHNVATCFLAGAFAALVSHKLMLLPAAVVVWCLWKPPETPNGRSWAQAISHPAVLGFAGGTALFWIWGLCIDASEFWKSHVAAHFLDRIRHVSAFPLWRYPSILELWNELSEHTGWILLPLGAGTLCWSLAHFRRKGRNQTVNSVALWAIWFLGAAVAFSIVDWRQTKHLMPLMLPLFMAPPACTSTRRYQIILVSLVFACVIYWNITVLSSLAANFESFHVTPGW